MSATSALAAAPAVIADEPVSEDRGDVAATAAVPVSAETSSETASEVPPTIPAQQPATESTVPAEAAPSPSDHERAMERIRQSTLPPALRERLAAAVEAGKSSQLTVEVCLEVIEQALPDFLRGSRDSVVRQAHPIGDTFFSGGDGELTDAEAETLAQRQLARSGLLRGQRVKVAD